MYCFCRSSKTISVRIIFLDETDFLHEIQKELCGQSLLEVVFARLNLLETSYFGLRFLDLEGQTHWLDANQRLSRQLKESKDIYELYFSVKFYAVDPCKLIEEITRYQFYLQLKQDVLQGRLPVTYELASQLGAYVVQSEIGDYDQTKHSYGYVSEFRIMPGQSKDLESRIADIHKQLKGIGPAQAEFNFLDKVKWLDMYGVDLHPVLGEDSVEYFLGLTPSGIIVLRNKSTVAHYFWPRIAKVYFKGRYFMIRVCDKNNEVSTYGFETPKKMACKHLWKCCVEHHAFFRLIRVSPAQPPAAAVDFFSLGSRFRYSGRTERQASKEASNINRIPPAFTRRPSRRQIRRDFDATLDKTFETDNRKFETKSISVPQPAYTIDSAYRSTCSIPSAFNNNNNNTINMYSHHSVPDSPRSTRSAGWAKSQQRGLFGINSSPKSVRSASSRNGNGNATTSHRQRSSSVESQSSNDSRSGRRHRSRSKRISDNESEMSRGSGRSTRSHRKHRRHRSRNRDGASDRGSSRNEVPALVDSGKQWLEVQRKQAEISSMGTVQQAAVVKSNTAPKSTNSTDSYNRSKKNRKHRSPADSSSKIWSQELSQHLQFDLVETSGMTEDQLKEIPYTVVETSQNRKRNNTSSLKVHKSAYGKDRVDRIRGPQIAADKMDGSIRSGSTNSSSQDFDRSNGLNRMMSTLSMGDFVNSSNLNRIDYSGVRVSHEHTDSGLGDQDYAYSSERSSDSAKYTNKSSGTSVLSGNFNTTSFHPKFYSGTNQRDNNERQSLGSINNIKTAPVHKKVVANFALNDSNNHIINRFINNNNSQAHRNHYSLNLKRHAETHNANGVGCISTLTSPYAGYGVEKLRGTKSDIGVPLDQTSTTSSRRLQQKKSILQKSALSSVYSDMSIYKATTFRDSHDDIINNNNDSPMNSAITFSKTGSKLLYTNKHRLSNSKVNHAQASSFGPLVFKNDRDNGNWKRSTFDNPLGASSGGLSGLAGIDKIVEGNSSYTNDRNNFNKSASLELILSPIIQSRRAKP